MITFMVVIIEGESTVELHSSSKGMYITPNELGLAKTFQKHIDKFDAVPVPGMKKHPKYQLKKKFEIPNPWFEKLGQPSAEN